MTTAPSPWTHEDHNGPAKPAKAAKPDDDDDTAEDKATPDAPVNPLLSIARVRQLPKE